MSSLGKRLREARKNKKLTQQDVSNKLGMDFTTISKYENDKSEPDLETIFNLSKLYDVNASWILGSSLEKQNHVREDMVEFTDLKSTIRLLEEEAAKMGMSPSDPSFKKMLSDALDILRIARGDDSK